MLVVAHFRRLAGMLTFLSISLALLVLPSLVQSSSHDVIVTLDHDGTRITLTDGQRLIVKLEGHPATGYVWDSEQSSSLLQPLGDPVFEAPSPTGGKTGAPALQVLTFLPVRAGEETLTLVYRRPWDRAVQRTFSIRVETLGRFTVLSPAAQPSSGSTPPPVVMGAQEGLPAAFNWCDQGACTPVKDQGVCGSCWAFATTGVVESALKRIDGVERDLSEQYLISAGTHGTCNGGGPAYDLFIGDLPAHQTEAGAVYESDLPYLGQDVPLTRALPHHERLLAWNQVVNADIATIKRIIYEHGPVDTALCVGLGFMSYQSGVFETDESVPCYAGHAVVLVGWDDSRGSRGAWRLRNSWGSMWGEGGYMWIGYGVSGIGQWINYVRYDHLAPGTSAISGRVWSLEGSGLAHVVVSDGVRSVSTDQYGLYVVKDVPPGTYTLTPSRSGFAFFPSSRTVTVSTGRNLNWQNFQSLPTYTVSGRVTDVAGNGVAGVTISDGTRSATTDAQGRYTLTNVPYGNWYQLTPSHNNYVFNPTQRWIKVSGDLSGQDFSAICQSCTISGRVTDSAGNGIAGVTISNGTHSATTDAQGRYALNVPPGEYWLVPSRNGYTFNPERRWITVNRHLSGQDFTATLATYVIRGRVTDSAGNGIAGVTISDGTRSATTDAQGRYALTNVPQGGYWLTPSHNTYVFNPTQRWITVNGDLNGQDFTATLVTYVIRGRVTDGAGNGVAGVTISDGTRSATTDAQGFYALSGVPAGAYTLTPSRDGYAFAPASRTVTVTGDLSGQDFTATLVTYAIRGRVTDSAGNGVAGVTVSDGTRSATTDAQGFYALSGVPAGAYTLTPSRDGYAFAPASRTVTVTGDLSGQDFTATLVTYAIRGRVTDSAGNGVAGVTISDGMRSATTDAQGFYALSGVPAGAYTLTPSRDGYAFAPASRTVTVTGEVSGQDFTATLVTYAIRGRVTDGAGNGVVGVTISDGTRSATTDAQGFYALSGVPAGAYTLTPSRDGYAFAPASRTVTVTGDLSGQDFTATLVTYAIRGRVTDGAGNGVAGVTISDGTRSATTDAQGFYALSGVPAGAYTLTPSRDGYAFAPASRTVTVAGDLSGQDFTVSSSAGHYRVFLPLTVR
jgi:inhibitor of cysteine peptidase